MKKGRKNKPIKKQLPSKICLHCGLPFSWRKKWQRNWPQVKYCSKRCQRSRQSNY